MPSTQWVKILSDGSFTVADYIRENLMRKLYEIFKALKVQKRIVSSEIQCVTDYYAHLLFSCTPG